MMSNLSGQQAASNTWMLNYFLEHVLQIYGNYRNFFPMHEILK